VFYLERIPAAPLARYVHILWYAKAPRAGHARERILPTGRVQVILNLARDYLLDCAEGEPDRPIAPALVVGARSVYEIVCCEDMSDLIGLVFRPGCFSRFASDAADLFSNRSVPLEDVWGRPARTLRERLREIPDPEGRLSCLEEFLTKRFTVQQAQSEWLCRGAVHFALQRFAESPSLWTVREVARSAGWSERRFSQVFREEVGFSPKVWCRIQRFQRAVRLMHAGREVAWSELSLDCGFYDQSHFSNEFRAFSGVNPTAYSAQRTLWANHIRAD
jgi:AraC-like DNA-binding protein